MRREFREFVSRGNVFDLAVGIVIGAAFTTVVRSFVDDVLMPPIGWITGGVDFSDLYVNLSGGEYASLAEAKEAGAATINYGLFNVISFLIVSFAVFLLLGGYNELRREKESTPPEPTEKDCPYCRFKIPIGASRCAHCTFQLAG